MKPNDFSEIKNVLIKGIDNTEFQNMYGFNRNVGIKSRLNKETNRIDLIIITWNKIESIYDNKLDIESRNELKYIGAGLEGNQLPTKTNKTLIRRFEGEIDCPIIFCSKTDKTLRFVSQLKPSRKKFKKERINGVRQFVFYFEVFDVNIENFIELSNQKKGVKPRWTKQKLSNQKDRRKKSKRIIKDKKLRELIEEMQFIGDIGELVAIDYEITRLKSKGMKEYVDLIEHTSFVKGHGYGYDILSHDKFTDNPDEEPHEIYIEVKSTKLNETQEFMMTKSEYEKMVEEKGRYRIYRVYNIYETGVPLTPILNPIEDLVIKEDEKKTYRCKIK